MHDCRRVSGYGDLSPQSLGSPVSVLRYFEDVDAFFDKALVAAAKQTRAVADQFDGDRRGPLTDPFGHVLVVASKKEEITLKEMQKRFEAMMQPAA